MKRIVIFASGSGTNAEAIMQHTKGFPTIEVALVVCNKPGAGVLERAERFGVPTILIEREGFYKTPALLDSLKEVEADLIVLAGFLWMIPPYLINAYPTQIINIHPALLPAYGGKGMYGMNVHKAVIAAEEVETGITIHYVNEVYDDGEILFQATCPVYRDDTPELVAGRIHQLEHKHFPKVITDLLNQ